MAKRSDRIRAAKGMSVIGVDLGDQASAVCVEDADGEIVEETKVKTRSDALAAFFGRRERCRVLLEVGTHSPWVSRLLEGLGHEVIVVNPYQVRLIAESVGKDDRSDAALLAELGRLGFRSLRKVEHRSAEAQADMEVLRARRLLVRQRAALVAHIRGVVKANGGRITGGTVKTPGAKVLAQVPGALRATITPLQEQVDRLSATIRDYDRQIDQLITTRYRPAQLLQSVRGVGPITALTYVLVIGAHERFEDSRQVGAYVGLTRRRRQSGERDPQLGISKAGDPELRRLLVQNAHYILSHDSADSALRRWALEKTEGGKGSYKRAAVALARKLAVVLHVLWKRGECYEPFPGKAGEEEEKREHEEGAMTSAA